MKNENPFIKNQDVELTIDGMTNEGQGVAHKDGVAFFVPETVVGETVLAHIIKVEKRYCVAKPLEIQMPSPERVKPRCEAYPLCGGCTLQHMSYEEQLKQKRQFVIDALERLGGLSDVAVEPVIGMENPWRYRNKGAFPFGTSDGTATFGFFAPRSHRLIPLFDCPIQSEQITKTARAVAAWANKNRISVYEETTGQGNLRACMVRVTSDKRIMAVVVTKGKLQQEEALKRQLSFVDSLYHNRNDKNTNVLLGDSFRLLLGEPTLNETQYGLSFAVSPQSFLQVNPVQTEQLYRTAIEYLAPNPTETIFDLYCGIGTISLQIAKRAGHVVGIECVPKAIEDAKKNAERNHLTNTDFVCDLSEHALPKLLKIGTRPDAIVLDPPRKGCEPQVIEAILQSTASRVVYVSCNPATLARDLKTLTAGGFVIQKVQPVDMFPHTAHVESVVLMSRAGS